MSPRRNAIPSFIETAALTFGGATSHRVDCGSAASVDNLTALTVLAWVYPTTLTAGRQFLSKRRNASAEGWSFAINGDGSFFFLAERATTDYQLNSTATPLTTNAWSFVAVTFNQATPAAALYWGNLVTLAAVLASSEIAGSGAFGADASRQLLIGNKDDASIVSSFQGRIAAIALLARVLSPAEIQLWQMSAFDEPAPKVMDGCRGLWYPGNESAASVIDYSGFGNNGAVTGATLSRGPSMLQRRAG